MLLWWQEVSNLFFMFLYLTIVVVEVTLMWQSTLMKE